MGKILHEHSAFPQQTFCLNKAQGPLDTALLQIYNNGELQNCIAIYLSEVSIMPLEKKEEEL